MARKVSDQQDEIARVYEELATHVLRERGFFLEDNLNASQAKTMASQLTGLAKDWRAKASKNRSIGN